MLAAEDWMIFDISVVTELSLVRACETADNFASLYAAQQNTIAKISRRPQMSSGSRCLIDSALRLMVSSLEGA
jgi:hypothetical protein